MSSAPPRVPAGKPVVLTSAVKGVGLEALREQVLRSAGAGPAQPGVERILTSARTGEGVDELRAWLARLAAPAEVPA